MHAPGGVPFGFRQHAAGGAPAFQRGLYRNWRSRLAKDMHHRPIGIDEDLQGDLLIAFARRDLTAAFAESKLLLERRAGRKRIGRKRHADLAELDQPRDFAERVGAADVELQIAVFFDPQVQADLAVAQHHGARGVLAGRRPDNVAGLKSAGAEGSAAAATAAQKHSVKTLTAHFRVDIREFLVDDVGGTIRCYSTRRRAR